LEINQDYTTMHGQPIIKFQGFRFRFPIYRNTFLLRHGV